MREKPGGKKYAMKFLFVVIIMLDYLLLYGQRNENCKILDAF